MICTPHSAKNVRPHRRTFFISEAAFSETRLPFPQLRTNVHIHTRRVILPEVQNGLHTAQIGAWAREALAAPLPQQDMV